MVVLQLKITDTDVDNLISYLSRAFRFEYESHSEQFAILLFEDFYYRTMSTQLNMVVMRKKPAFTEIDIIGGAGGTGFMNIDWGSERSYTEKVEKMLTEYAGEHGFTLSTN